MDELTPPWRQEGYQQQMAPQPLPQPQPQQPNPQVFEAISALMNKLGEITFTQQQNNEMAAQILQKINKPKSVKVERDDEGYVKRMVEE